MKMDIDERRKEIDRIDKEILALLNKRAKEALQIAKLKKGKGIYSPERERKILNFLISHNRGPLQNDAIREIFSTIINLSRSLQKKLIIAYLGPEATFTHLAAIKSFGSGVSYLSQKTISGVFRETEKGRVDYGVVPVENSTEGIVSHTLDMFLDSELKIISEIMLPVSHYLMSKGLLKSVRRIYSHPQALAQCERWLEENLPSAEVKEVESTAIAAQRVAKEKGTAAIASELAAKIYNLKILVPHIEDSGENFTRFFIIGREFSKKSGNDKTSILFSIKDRVGALYDMLIPFRENNLNLTKIESRPTKEKPWEYVFFVDFEGYKDDLPVKRAISRLAKRTVFLKILGSYPKAE